jgi:hypothetical protein
LIIFGSRRINVQGVAHPIIACSLRLVRIGFENKRWREVLLTHAFDLSTTLACLALHIGRSFLVQLLAFDRPGGAGKVGKASQPGAKRGVVHEYDGEVVVGANAGECIFPVEYAFFFA